MIRNFNETELENTVSSHGGIGTLQHTGLFNSSDFKSGLKFLNYTVLPPNTSIGVHKHGNDEEIYVVLQGSGLMTLQEEKFPVSSGAVIVNPPFGTHGIENTGKTEMKLLVFEAAVSQFKD